MAGLSKKWIRERVSGLDQCEIANLLNFLNSISSASELDGPEPRNGPVYDDPTTGYGDQIKDYDIGEIVANRIINRRSSVGGFTDITQLSDIPYFGKDKFNDLIQFIPDGTDPKVILTDISGLSLGAGIDRIPKNEEPEGIACDGLANVDEGARILVRVLLSNENYNTCENLYTADFGYAPGGTFAQLPGSGNKEGRLYAPSSTEIAAIAALGIKLDDEIYESDNNFTVLKAMIYQPPIEFDLTTPNRTQKFRILPLAVELKGPVGRVYTKKIRLVRPPLVLVHGINAGPDSWSTFERRFRGFGFKPFIVDHSSVLDGNGDIHTSFDFVRDKIYNGNNPSALRDFRIGKAHGKKIAVQKCDVVGHSYGGILTRWYMEKSGDFPTRKDVRKLVTLGSPHRGAPITNVICEAFRNPLIFNAELDPASASPGFNMGSLLNKLNKFKVRGFIKSIVRWHDGPANYNPATPGTAKVVPALQVLSYGSQVLGQLNANPFINEAAYGSIVGIDTTVNAHVWLNPHFDPLGFGNKSYFPWIKALDGAAGASDGIVPVWSQTLPKRTKTYDLNHISYAGDEAVQEKTRDWLNDKTLPKGALHRAAFNTAVIPNMASRNNVYQGSTLVGNTSVGAGIKPAAIHKTEVSMVGIPITDAITLGTEGGLVVVHMQGMVSTAGRTISVMSKRGIDAELHKNIVVPYAGAGELQPFAVTGVIGRKKDGDIAGPHGSKNDGKDKYYIGWKISGAAYKGWDGLEGPQAFVTTTKFKLPKVVGPATVPVGGAAFTAKGGVIISTPAGGNQAVKIEILDDDPYANPSDLMVTKNITVPIPANGFNGVLIPYSVGFSLFKNGAGDVAGSGGTSNESTAEVYQQLKDTGTGNPKSSRKKVSAN